MHKKYDLSIPIKQVLFCGIGNRAKFKMEREAKRKKNDKQKKYYEGTDFVQSDVGARVKPMY